MDFYERQARARTASRRLVLLFVLAVVLVLLAVNLVGELAWKLATAGAPTPPYFVLTNSFVVLLFVVGGAWLESLRLADGGGAIAHRLGARSLDEYDLRHRRLANVVDEMAIAAGIAVPEVFVLDDPTINALTAGDEPTRCAIIVTRGAVERLDRAELQGVVAHEIAHVVHGDVALNTRAAGALYGLMSLSVMGRGMMAAAWPRATGPAVPGRRRVAGLPWPGLWLGGAVLAGVGWVGHLAGRLIQAGLSRQRELLADARAIELTRDPHGLGRALRKVAGQRGRRLESEYADVVAHLLLAGQTREHGWFDSHPSLALRIRRIYGRYMPPIESVVEARVDVAPAPLPALAPLEFPAGDTCPVPIVIPIDEPAGGIGAALSVEALVGASMSAADHANVLLSAVRALSPSFEQASRLLRGLVATPTGTAEDVPEHEGDDPLAAALAWVARPEALWLRLPLLEVLTARLRPWPRELHERLLVACREAVEADGRIDKTEWVYYTLVRHRLLPPEAGREPTPDELRRALAELFGLAAAIGEQSARGTREAVSRAADGLGIAQPVSTSERPDAASLARALEILAAIPPLQKPALLKSLGSLARDADEPRFQAFLAAVAAAIDCPPLRVRGGDRWQFPDEALDEAPDSVPVN